MSANTKLELTWIGKDEIVPSIEPRILIEHPDLSCGVCQEESLPNGKIWKGNMIIHGDNLLALRSIEDYKGCVKCIYIDPPFNTGNAFEFYDDGLEHSIWLNLMYQRIKLLYGLLSEDGAFCMHLDDGEVHYAKVICDEIFGRRNFIATVAIRSSTPSGVKTAHKNKKLIKQKDLMLVYKKSDLLTITPQYVRRSVYDTHFNYYADKENGTVRPLLDVLIEKGVLKKGDKLSSLDINNPEHRKFYVAHADRICQTQSFKNEDIKKASREYVDKIYFINKGESNETMFYNGRQLTPLKNSINKVLYGDSIIDDMAVLLCDFWDDMDFQNTQHEGGVDFPNSKKPEALIMRILSLFTDEGDIVLDSFLGSGTTAAVAHKMKRKYIGIELGDHAYSHCQKRLATIVEGSDQSGITKAINWKGGGGFKFYELAPSLLKKDSHGNLVINKEYNADMLSAAMAKHQGFVYQPSPDVFWKQGYSSENDYIFTTTQFMTVEALAAIEETMKEDESLLVCCKAFQPECKSFSSRISVKKIPTVLLDKCEFDHDDYSLNIIELPQMESDEKTDNNDDASAAPSDRNDSDLLLF